MVGIGIFEIVIIAFVLAFLVAAVIAAVLIVRHAGSRHKGYGDHQIDNPYNIPRDPPKQPSDRTPGPPGPPPDNRNPPGPRR